MRRLVAGVLAVSCLAPAAARATASDICVEAARQMERAEGIPPGLVQAVALAESGRWLAAQRTSRPWPWTVTSGQDNFYLASKAAALAKVRELRARGRSNIDVGCMQVNLGYHPDAFGSLDEAFDPAVNVAYGARFLKRLRQETRSWARATARYHSNDPDRGLAYRTKVYRLWYQLRRRRLPFGQRTAHVGGAPLVVGANARHAEPPRQRRLIIPAITPSGYRSEEERPPPPGGIAILRGN